MLPPHSWEDALVTRTDYPRQSRSMYDFSGLIMVSSKALLGGLMWESLPSHTYPQLVHQVSEGAVDKSLASHSSFQLLHYPWRSISTCLLSGVELGTRRSK